MVGFVDCTDGESAEGRQINSGDKAPSLKAERVGLRFDINDLARTEEESFERIFEDDDHWRNVVPPTRCPRPDHLVLRTSIVKRLAGPISHSLKLDQLGDLAGIGAATALSILVLILISFVAGIVARTAIGGRLSRWSETSLLGRLPHYQLIKSMAEGFANIESASGLKPALVCIEDGWQIGYLLEQLENDWVAVFLPQAPTPMSGNIMYFPANRVRLLGITMVQAMSIVKAIGVGSGAALHGVNLTLPIVKQ